ncbi:ABC transporter ATP-binding protein [Sulfurimonas autotrophica]|uniref:ABC transporter related protein n=1 Tax=Sulfurimonas autotrophica (strain ATCC BAA-671 / DSM 16294 / JCM 11897 / OK10) TaxID=563040 RepID=E0USW4_SULAO|nr:ABC transporter ATP-binding protein [Sulfurimonas autotrophica]ADN08141.1 ABC transporter related protein [Sulfurimonas autotrophica DSM 16294]
MIKLHNLTCKYENNTVFENISLDINTHLSILGANGSGKSTLAKAICSLIDYEGEIFLEHKNTKALSLNEKAKLIAYIPAKLEIYDPDISVSEFVLLGRFAYKKSFFDYSEEDKNITKEMLEFLNIIHLSEHLVSQLSSGEQQLVLIAQALTQQSKIIIFDEPTANLDPHNSKIIASHIKELKARHTVILITHDLHLAASVNTPVLFIKNKSATYYEKDFFNDASLGQLYGVAFESLAVKYD